MITQSVEPPAEPETERLRRDLAALRTSLVATETNPPADWRLTAFERTVFQALLKRETVAKATIVQLLHGADAPASARKNIDVFISRIRRKTAPFGVTIETIFGVGYRLLDREAWLKAIEARIGRN